MLTFLPAHRRLSHLSHSSSCSSIFYDKDDQCVPQATDTEAGLTDPQEDQDVENDIVVQAVKKPKAKVHAG